MSFGAFVQEANSNTALTVAFGSNNAAGNLLVVICGEESTAGSITGVSDTQGNPWILLPQLAGAGHISRAGYCLSCKAGANTVTFTISGSPSGFGQIAVCEYLGPAALNASAQGTGNDNPTVGIPVAATVGPVLIVGADDDSYGDPWVGAGGYTVRTVSAFALRTSIYDQVFGVPGTYTPILTTPNTAGHGLSSLAFVAGVAGGASGWVNAQRDFVNLRNS